jgi:hypothetical protein
MRSDAEKFANLIDVPISDSKNFADSAKLIFHFLCRSAHDVLHNRGHDCKAIAPIRSLYRKLSIFVEKCVVQESHPMQI